LGADPATSLTLRLPADATLIILGSVGAGDERTLANLAALIAAWREQELPVAHVAAGGFAGTELERLLDDSGATTLVLCGELGPLEAAVRDAVRLGYHAFVPLDACWPEASRSDSVVQRLASEEAAVVDTASALLAVATAKFRQRRLAERGR
jgi:nicotinamidase-related amidase